MICSRNTALDGSETKKSYFAGEMCFILEGSEISSLNWGFPHYEPVPRCTPNTHKYIVERIRKHGCLNQLRQRCARSNATVCTQ